MNSKMLNDRKWPIPAYKTPYIDTLCLLMNNQDEMTIIQKWWSEYCLLPRQHFIDNIWPAGLYFASYSYPNCQNMDRFKVLVKWMTWLFVWDNHNKTKQDKTGRNTEAELVSNKHYQLAIDRLERLYIEGKSPTDRSSFIPMSKWGPYVLCMYAIGEKIMAGMNVDQRRRYATAWRRYIVGQHTENLMVDNKHLYEDLDELMQKVRIPKCAGETSIALIEYANGLVVPESEWTDPLIAELRRLCVVIIIYMNDIYTFEKELLDWDSCMESVSYNLVAYRVLKDKLSVNDSITQCLANCYKLEAEFDVLYGQALGSDRYCPDTKKFVDGLKQQLASVYNMSTKLDRYGNQNMA